MSAERRIESDPLESGPALARAAAGVWWRASRWGAGATLRTGTRLARFAADPVLSAQVVAELGSDLREYARDLLGITELDERVRQLMPPPDDPGSHNGRVPESVSLRVKGALLLRAAADVDTEEHAHPAYARILTQLAPDEGRILRLLATQGAQPSVDVRSTNLLGVGSQLIAGGLSMIGAEAGVLHRDRLPAYVNNLERLGLIWFSREPLENPIAYQVLEAQPEVLDAIKRVPRAKTTQRSIHLTPFGHDFCDTCLPLDPAEVQALTQHT